MSAFRSFPYYIMTQDENQWKWTVSIYIFVFDIRGNSLHFPLHVSQPFGFQI